MAAEIARRTARIAPGRPASMRPRRMAAEIRRAAPTRRHTATRFNEAAANGRGNRGGVMIVDVLRNVLQ